MVLATQNPLDTEGTYPLPEAQLDRFLLKIDMCIRRLSEEVDIVTRTTTDQTGEQLPLAGVTPVLNERGDPCFAASGGAAAGRRGGDRLRGPHRARDARLARDRHGQPARADRSRWYGRPRRRR